MYEYIYIQYEYITSELILIQYSLFVLVEITCVSTVVIKRLQLESTILIYFVFEYSNSNNWRMVKTTFKLFI